MTPAGVTISHQKMCAWIGLPEHTFMVFQQKIVIFFMILWNTRHV